MHNLYANFVNFFDLCKSFFDKKYNAIQSVALYFCTYCFPFFSGLS